MLDPDYELFARIVEAGSLSVARAYGISPAMVSKRLARRGETVEAMQALVAAGKVRHWGVSNLDTGDMGELIAAGGGACATDQILYNLSRRGCAPPSATRPRRARSIGRTGGSGHQR